MAICAKKGFHVVWVPSLVEDPELRESLSELITVGNVSALCFAEERHPQDVGRLKREMKVKTVITYKREKVEPGRIVLNPQHEPNFQPYTELYFLVENLMDAGFYHIVLRLYRREKGFAPYGCVVYPLMGGGVTTAKVMENEVALRQHYCFPKDSQLVFTHDKETFLRMAGVDKNLKFNFETFKKTLLYDKYHTLAVEDILPLLKKESSVW